MQIGNIYYNRINTENHTNWWEWDFYSKVAEIVSKDKLVKKYNFRIYLTDPSKIQPTENDIVILTSFETYDIPKFIDIPFLTFKQYAKEDIEHKLYGLPLGLNYPVIHTPILKIKDRPIDICFLGQYENRYNRKYIIDFIKQKFSKYNLCIGSNKSVIEYYLSLANSKISLSLDGGMVPEAYRFFEALRYGCITIANAYLLNLDIYKNAPFVATDWNNLELVEKQISLILSNIDKFNDIPSIAYEFWNKNYSVQAQADFIIDKIHRKIYNNSIN
jgi:hypothetical protein